MELVLLPYSVACAFYDHLLTDHLRTTTYFEPEADWPQPIVSQNNLLISLQQLYLLGDTRSRRELLVFAEANAARLPLAMGIFANRYTYPAHGCENERQNLSWCLESVMPWRGIMGFTNFGDKRINDLGLLQGYVVGVACLHREIPCRRICIHLASRTS